MTYNGLVVDSKRLLVRNPEEVVYRSCYAPVDLRGMLDSAETRSRIRHLAPAHLFFGVKELEEQEVMTLLPHVTQEQWTAILDLDLWSKDRVSLGQFIYWARFILQAEDPVAAKLIRAADPELWELLFRRHLKVYTKNDDDLEGEPEEGEWLDTPDGNYLVVLPRNPERARLLRALLLRVYELDPGWAALTLESSRYRTTVEAEEVAYGNRKRRIEELGFQDYYQAIEIYSLPPPEKELPQKKRTKLVDVTNLPSILSSSQTGPLLVFRAFATLTSRQEMEQIVEDLLSVCNKVLSADRIAPTEPSLVKRGIRKAITGINLGLELWSEAELGKARHGLRRHYLKHFFQIGHAATLELQKEARRQKAERKLTPGSFEEAFVHNLSLNYPLLAVASGARVRRRFIATRQQLEEAREQLGSISKTPA
jgi:hypothetical protein